MSETKRNSRSKESGKKGMKAEKKKPSINDEIINTMDTQEEAETSSREQQKQEQQQLQEINEKNPAKSPHMDKKPFKTYNHNVSEIKQNRNNYSYFNFKSQIDGVFESELKQKAETQKPIEIAEYGLKRGLIDNGTDSFVVNKKRKRNNATDCSFETEQINLVKIKDIESLPDSSIISIIGKLNITSHPQFLELNGKQLSLLQCKIADDTDCIDITFWDDQIDQISNDSTYKISNVRVRTFQGNKYISLNSESKINSTKPLQSVARKLFEEDSCIDTIEAEHVDCVRTFTTFYSCKNCKEKLPPLQGKLETCMKCSAKQIINIEKEQINYSLILIFKEANLSLTIFKNQMAELIRLYNNDNETKQDTFTIDEDTLNEICLSITKVKFFYNKNTNIVTSVEKMMNQ